MCPANLCVRVPEGVDFAQAPSPRSAASRCTACVRPTSSSASASRSSDWGWSASSPRQILRAAGCTRGRDRPLAGARRARARRPGRDEAFVRSDGSRAAATATRSSSPPRRSSSDPVELAAELCRDRGRVVVVGDVGMEVPRAAVLREGARAARVALVRSGPLRPGVRGARARLSGRLRALDRAAEHGRVSRAGRVRAGRRSKRSSTSASPSTRRRRRTNGSWAPSARRSASCSSTSRVRSSPARAGSSGDEDVLGSRSRRGDRSRQLRDSES